MCNVLYHQLLDDNESNIEYKTIGEIAKKVITGKTPSTKNKEYWGWKYTIYYNSRYAQSSIHY